eukprot:1913186-Rhodomonas_salina.1
MSELTLQKRTAQKQCNTLGSTIHSAPTSVPSIADTTSSQEQSSQCQLWLAQTAATTEHTLYHFCIAQLPPQHAECQQRRRHDGGERANLCTRERGCRSR